MTTPDFGGISDVQTPEQQELLHKLASELDQCDRELEQLEARTEAVKERRREIAENALPELMLAMGVKEWVTADGLRFKLREEVRASFFAKNPEKREPAFAWLDANDHGSLIKNTISVRLSREQAELAEEIKTLLKQTSHPVDVEQKRDIHHQSLLAFLREQLKEGTDVPLPLFGAFVQKYAEIKRDKK